LKFFTWLDPEAIHALERETAAAPERREAQRVLAHEVTAMVHGVEQTQSAERASAVLFGSSLANATVEEILTVFDDVPSLELGRAQLEGGLPMAELVVSSGLAASKGEATRLIKQGGLYANDHRWLDERGRVNLDHAIEGRVIVLRKGQRERRIVKIRVP
jgi:tyrosyl-tRNA synthetase